jgi:hypothetical protein
MAYLRKVVMDSQDLDVNLKWVRSQLVRTSHSLFPQNLAVVSSLLYLGSELPLPILM